MSESNKNKTAFSERLGRFVSPLLNSSTKDRPGVGDGASGSKTNSGVNLSRVISLNSLKRDNYSPSLKRPYSSIKQLNLPPSVSNLSESLNNNSKRQRTSEDSFGLFNISGDLQRPSSRLSLSSLSSAYTGGSDFNRSYRNLFSRTNSPQSIPNSATSELNFAPKQKNSSFYQGRTSFGGANIQQSSRRLSCTPYATKNINFVNVNSKTNDTIDKLNSNSINLLSLSSKTKKILDKLERASTPLSTQAVKDAAHPYRRPASSLSSPYPLAKSNSRQSKLTDTVQPSALNNGRLNVDTSHKTKKFILTSVDEDEDEADVVVDAKKPTTTLTTTLTKVNNSFDKDVEKLNEIINAEKELQKEAEAAIVPRKNITFGKISQRDIKKGRKLSDSEPTKPEEIEHLNNLANAKPLGLGAAASLKSLTFSFGLNKSTNQDATKQAKEIPLPIPSQTHLKSSTIGDASSSFKFSSPITISSTIPSKSTSSFHAEFSSPVLLEAKTAKSWMPNIVVSNPTSVILKEKQNILGVFDSTRKSEKDSLAAAEARPITKNAADNATSKPASVEAIFKKKSTQLWTCSTCCVDNEPELERCAACEEPNPDKSSAVAGQANKPATPQFNFGSFGKVDAAPKPLVNLFKKETKSGGWKCSVCDVDNEESDTKCVSCEEPNPASSKQAGGDTVKPSPAIPMFGSFGKPAVISNAELPTAPNNQLTSSNGPEASKRVSFEVPNPKNADNKATNPTQTFKFGNFSAPAVVSSVSTTPVKKNENLAEGDKSNAAAAAGDEWKCFYCKATNDSLAKTCSDCDKIKTPAVTKDEMVKFCNSQSYKFGFTKPAVNSSEEKSGSTTEVGKLPLFAFGAPTTTTTEAPKSLTSPPAPLQAVAFSIPNMNAKPLSVAAVPSFTFGKLPDTPVAEKQPVVENKATLLPPIGSTFLSPTKEVPNVSTFTEKKDAPPSIKFDSTPLKSTFTFDASKITKPASLAPVSSSPLLSFGSSTTTTTATAAAVTLTSSGSTITGSNLFGNKVSPTTGSTSLQLPKLNSIVSSSTSSSAPLTSTFTFGASAVPKPAENKAPTLPSLAPSSNLFQFGTAKASETKPFTVAATTASLSIPSTFTFGAPKPSVPSASGAPTASLFTFGSAAAAPAAPTQSSEPQSSAPTAAPAPVSGSTNIFKPGFNFGSPLTTPELKAGEPLKLSMNFGLPKTTTLSSTGNTPSNPTFTFGSSSSSGSTLVPPISFGKNLGEVNKININMPSSAASSTSAAATPAPLFGNLGATQAAQAAPPTLGSGMFNFSAASNNQSNATGMASSNLFSFGSAASNVNQQQPAAAPATPQTTGNAFNFFGSGGGEQKNQTMTFGTNMFGGTGGIASQQPQQPPTFGMPFTQTLKVNAPGVPNNTCQLPGAPTNNNNNNQFAVNPFQFNSAAGTADSSNNSRIIKKARRRLK